MPDTPEENPSRAVRDLADDHVRRLAALDPVLAGELGHTDGQDRLGDLSPAGQDAIDALDRETLDRLTALTGDTPPSDPDERRCARLLSERLRAGLDVSASGENLRAVQELFGPVQGVRLAFTLMPVATEHDWANVAGRMSRVPQALREYRESLTEGDRRGLYAAPRQVERVAEQIDSWVADGAGRGWFSVFADGASRAPLGDGVRADLATAAPQATGALVELRDWLRTEYLPRAEGTPDGVGAERYRLASRYWNGADIDTDEVYAWGWSEFRRLREEMAVEAERVKPGAGAAEAMAHLDRHGDVVVGGEAARARLQTMMDDTIADLGRTHFDLAEPIRTVEACLAPAGSAAAPYYTPPTLDFSRPGRTWLPQTADDRYPMWDLISTWYHEGVPGHHLQMAQWAYRAADLSSYQANVGSVSANLEGWALYAELLMDELGYHTDPGSRMGYLNGQMLRAIRVVIDIGMHLSLPIPDDSPVGAGLRWTPELGREFFRSHVGGSDELIDSELLRYLGAPGQAIGYKLGERVWLAGRDAARRAHTARGGEFDVKAWHMTALSQGSLGLDDLAGELAAI
ncbi:uncharacterized protein (DUF885 family) [Pseudonocardia sediminis]|uniref:Uncharacterized protein (DUF885 family) n=1 Tax=Pseudonocardia sediminis TaxID=1397368 RepID=A0A4V2FQX9_PSEST|nr:DUF885 domain-containing protein [Pseudonocardia sediminis]RZT86420.1 uncharacterized protein (DUF885 family) [Pseudonocardia sediminis]